MSLHKETVTIGERTITLETGRLARQAHGAVLLRDGDTAILSTVTYNPAGREGLGFFPLTVDYREYMSAAGRIPGSFLRREGRGSDGEVLASRLCDRSVRPLFPKAFQAETQILSTVLSYDPSSDTPLLSIIGAAAALHISEIPWGGPLAAVRVGRREGVLTLFPPPDKDKARELDLAVSLTREGLVMIEGGALQLPEAELLEALALAREQAQPLLEAMEALRRQAGREKIALAEPPPPPAFAALLEKRGSPALTKALADPVKQSRHLAVAAAKRELLAALEEERPDETVAEDAPALLDQLEARLMRERILKEGKRVDGRGLEDIRPISCEVDWLAGPHGSALFTRGETQAMVTLTLGSGQDKRMIESLTGISHERFMLHYSFPAYSVGEVRPLRGPARREVGHGALARRALEPVMPEPESFPYTLRIVSEISESNGSSSMATVCGASLAMLDGGVPLTSPVAGIAMGLIKEGEQLAVLSDILGDEDHLGDMDFKVAGTEEGITAIQMDNKIGSLPDEVLARAFEQARRGRLHILAEMARTIAAPRDGVKSHVPLILTMNISSNRVRELIGPGGKVIQQIQRDNECRLEVEDGGQVRIYAPNKAAGDAARAAVQEVAGSLEAGEVYDAVVTGVKEFGAFVKTRGYEGLVHVSEWSGERVERMSAVAKPGDKVRIKVMGTDRAGRLTLSRKEAL